MFLYDCFIGQNEEYMDKNAIEISDESTLGKWAKGLGWYVMQSVVGFVVMTPTTTGKEVYAKGDTAQEAWDNAIKRGIPYHDSKPDYDYWDD